MKMVYDLYRSLVFIHSLNLNTQRQQWYTRTVWQITTKRCANSSILYTFCFYTRRSVALIFYCARHFYCIEEMPKSQYCVWRKRTVNVMCVLGAKHSKIVLVNSLFRSHFGHFVYFQTVFSFTHIHTHASQFESR